MDLHPIFVHFPIALLTVYGVLELIRFRKVCEKPYWFYVKAVLAIFGSLGAIAAFATGPDEIAHASKLGEMHANFALATLILSGIIALHYLLRWLRHAGYHHGIPAIPNWLLVLLALVLLASVTITGGLGGALVYGTHFDPLMKPVFQFLGVY